MGQPLPAKEKNKTNGDACLIANHEYATGGFSSMYMSRNRVRAWHEPSFTIQASCRHAPIHPQANKMIKVEKDKFIFDPDSANSLPSAICQGMRSNSDFPRRFYLPLSKSQCRLQNDR